MSNKLTESEVFHQIKYALFEKRASAYTEKFMEKFMKEIEQNNKNLPEQDSNLRHSG
jgi:hypothetical protein